MTVESKEVVGVFQFHQRGMYTAVYLDGELVWYGEDRPGGMWWVILQSWGYELQHGEEIPAYEKHPEFDWSAGGHWQPPKILEVLERQLAAYKARKRRQLIANLREELERLEQEEKTYKRSQDDTPVQVTNVHRSRTNEDQFWEAPDRPDQRPV